MMIPCENAIKMEPFMPFIEKVIIPMKIMPICEMLAQVINFLKSFCDKATNPEKITPVPARIATGYFHPNAPSGKSRMEI